MSSSGSLAGITFGGIASGIDTNSIITKLVQVESVPLQTMQTRQQTLTNQQTVYSQLQSALTNLGTAAKTLDLIGAFSTVTGNVVNGSSTVTAATLTAGAASTAGTYNLIVTNLAQAQKVATSAQTDTTSALNQTGTFVIDGKSVSIVASDSLSNVASKINGLNVGATASLIDGGSGSAYLTIAATTSGVANKLQMSDLSGSVLGNLGILSGASTVRSPVTNGAASYAFNSNSATLGSMLGSNGSPSTISINGSPDISIDMSTDTLQTVADKINGAGITGVQASVQTTAANGVTSYALNITGATTPTFTDPGNVLGAIGIVQQGTGKELVKGQDASFSLDGVPLTSASNTVTTAIPGSTLTLLAGTPANPATATVSLTADTAGVEGKIKAFTDAYNTVIDFISQNSTFDSKTYNTGPLFGDAVANQVESSLSRMLFNNVPGLTGTYKNMADLGFSLDQNGDIQGDQTKISTALTTNPSAVAAIFQASGTGSTQHVQYVSSTSKTQSTATPYSVTVSQLATQASFLSGTQQTTANPNPETLLFNGSLFGNTTYKLNLDVGSTLSSMISKINNDSTLKNIVVASDSNGFLSVVSKRYGSNGNFTLTSDHSSSSSNSGIGVGGEGTTTNGLDVQGTINGEPATGSGQFLTGNSGNSKTDGLQIMYDGTQTGSVGTISYSSGVAMQANTFISSITDSVNGLITAADKGLQTQIDDIQKQMDTLNTYLTNYTNDLRTKFSNMESAIAAAQQQSASLTSILGSSSSSSSSATLSL